MNRIIWVHILFWAFIVSIIGIFGSVFSEPLLLLRAIGNTLLFGILVFYGNLLWASPELLKDNFKLFISKSLSLLVGLYAIRMLSLPVFDLSAFLSEFPYRKGFLLFLQLFILVVASTAYAIVRAWLLEREQQAREGEERLKNEIRFLRNQVNPHFLFNSLNNIYSLAFRKHDSTAPMVAKLARIMRYLLEDCSENRVSLEKELAMLEDYIDLQKMKTEHSLQVDFYREGILPEHEIAPMVLINFVENAFKHSDSETKPGAWISMNVEVDDQNIFTFSSENSLGKSRGKYSGGRGLDTAEKILRLHYPDGYSLEWNTDRDVFKLTLSISL